MGITKNPRISTPVACACNAFNPVGENMETLIDGVSITVPGHGWYSGRSGMVGLYVRVEAECVEPFFIDLYLFSSNQSIQGDTCIRRIKFHLSLEGDPSKQVFRLLFEPKLMQAFEGTVVQSIGGTWVVPSNRIELEIAIAYGWLSWTLRPSMSSVKTPHKVC